MEDDSSRQSGIETEEPQLELKSKKKKKVKFDEDSENAPDPKEKPKTVNEVINDKYGIEKLDREFAFRDDVKVVDSEGTVYSVNDLQSMSDRRFKQVRNSIHISIGNMLKTIGENKELTDKLLPAVNMTISTIEIIALERRVMKLEKNHSRSSKTKKRKH